jgi:hypothetical protein
MIKRLAIILLTVLLVLSSTPAHAQTPTPTTGPVYIVREGDTLWDIAAIFYTSVDDLVAANGLTGGDIYPGDQLTIPGMEGLTGTLTLRTIAYGENLRTLVRQYQLDETLLRKLNHLTSPTELYAGANLILLQEEDQTGLSARANLASNETLLELAVREETDPWTITGLNGLRGTWAGLPEDMLYLPGGTSTGTPTGLPAIFGTVEVNPLPIIQGTTTEIKITPTGEAVLGGMLVDQKLQFFPLDDEKMIALQGVHVLTEPGLYPLRIEATLPDGTIQSFEQNVLISSGDYPNETLHVEPSMIDPAVTEPEMEQILTIVEPATPDRYWDGIFTTPASDYEASTYLSSPFGTRRIYVGIGTTLEISGFHSGLDFGGGTGLPITAPAAGRIVFAGPLIVRGNATIIDHGWGIYSGFWHQSEIQVQVGDIVQQGQVIGLVGGTGRVTGAHLHWEVWANGVQVNPLQWLTEKFPH